MVNPYRVLGIPPHSNFEVARRQYIFLAKKYHPDNFASSRYVSEEKMKNINNAFNLIKEAVHHKILHVYNKGKFSQYEINEIVSRFKKDQSLNKIARDMKRSREAIRRYLIKLGYIAKPVKKHNVAIKPLLFEYFVPNWHTMLFIFMTISIIISGAYMGLMCLALICLISD